MHLPMDAPEAQRRLALARWITDPRNPLPARVLVNRLWHYHFGQGLVTTPSSPYKSAADLIAAAKAHPGEVNYGSGGNISHVEGEISVTAP